MENAELSEVAELIDLELDLSEQLLHDLENSAQDGLNANEVIQAADKSLLLGLRFGSLKTVGRAKRVAELLPSVDDPVLRCSFGSTFSCALNLGAYYEQALGVATAMVEDAIEYRVEFATPYGHLMRGAALAGLRRFDDAHNALSESLQCAARVRDFFGEQAVYAGRIRAFLHEGRLPEACALEPPDLSSALPAMRGEVWASRALALACMGRVDEAESSVDAVRGTTRAIEPNILGLSVGAITALKLRDSELADVLRDFVHRASAAGAVDYIITAYRASPELLAALLRDSVTAERTGYFVARAGDGAVAEALGIDLLQAVDPASSLTAREREVYALLCEGLSNADIARRLFISHPTVKVHVRHIYDKLGIRSRTALALHAASRRTHANPTARAGDSSGTAIDG